MQKALLSLSLALLAPVLTLPDTSAAALSGRTGHSADTLWDQRPSNSLQYVTIDIKNPDSLRRYTVTTEQALSRVLLSDSNPGFWDAPVRALADFESLSWNTEMLNLGSLPVSLDTSSVKVAVLDTGVSAHEDLTSLLPGFDFVQGDTDPTDLSGHGTHVAGVVSAARNQNGVLGVSPGVGVIPIRVLDANGSGLISNVVAGISLALERNARVINLSLGSTTDVPALKNAVDYAASKGVLVVAAAGNSGFSAQVSYPAAYQSVLAVASVTQSKSVSSFSSRGTYVDIAAPGSSVLSTYNDGSYRLMSGTSMASPHIAGAAALLFAAHPTASVQQVVQSLCLSAEDIDTPGQDQSSGCGLPSVQAASGILSSLVEASTPSVPSTTTIPDVVSTTAPVTASTTVPVTPPLTTLPAQTTLPSVPPSTTVWPSTTAIPPIAPPALPATQDSPGPILLSRDGTDLVLSWDPPASGAPDGYYVAREGSLPVFAQCCDFRDTNAATEYGVFVYKVFAFSKAGVSLPQMTSVALSPPAKPSMKASSIGRKRVRLQVSRVQPGSVLRFYRNGVLVYSALAQSRSFKVTLESQPAGRHIYTVRQESSLGTSKLSDATRLRIR